MRTCSGPALSGYQITEELYSGSRTLVYRAVRQADQQTVVIKLLKNANPSFSELVQFRNQYAIAKNLQISGIIKPDSLEHCGNGYALVMEDFGGESLRDFARNRSLPLEQFLPIALQLVDVLRSLHQQRIIHKDIKPANILIQPETQQVRLIDFSISSLLPRESQEIKNPNGLEGTLAYLSPEQTGRMNRGIDYRSDFYSLGITFYELLTGQLPFQSNDPMEMVHCHIAKAPRSICSLNPEIPLMLGAIVHKLMAKNAEDRYQSASGLEHDLITCITQWQTVSASRFKLGTRDLCDRFLIPEKLYGREPEVEALLAAFERIAKGAAELMLVAGFSGIGKTAVVNEVHKPIARQRGYFIKGKYDQLNRNIPFRAIVQAFRDLMGQLLSESDEQRAQWKDRILATLGENGQVLIEVVPELEQMIGKQPAAPNLSGSAAQNRFNLLFQQFVQVFATPEHPLVMFLDDLQWADSASLNLMQLLMQDTEHLLLIGAYRSNEVSLVHPLILTVDEIQKAGATVNTIMLQPLSLTNVNQLLADTLNCDRALAQPLAELVYQKTQGNPFFATQFLKSLHEDGHITFDLVARHWQCDITQIRALAITDNVVEFMALQLQKLPPHTQKTLKLAACIGAQFDLNTLAIVSEQSPEEAAATLWEALREGLLIPTTEIYKFFTQSDVAAISHAAANSVYRFLHDRVQQAAYLLIAEEQRPSIHLKIGQLLLNHTSDVEQTNSLFDIVNHLNRGMGLVTRSSEQEQLARLNGLAAQKARSATAYEVAMSYATTGITLLTSDCWQSQYSLAVMLHELAAETAFLANEFEQMDYWAEVVLQQAKTALDRVKVHEIKIQTYILQHRPLEAVVLGKQVLNQFGIQLPAQPTQVDTQQAFQHTVNQFADRPIEELLNLPSMTVSEPLAAMKIAASTAPAIYFAAPSLYPFLVLSQVNASIQHGNAPFSAFFYAAYGLLLNGILEDRELADRAGKLALGVIEKLNAKQVESRTRFLVGSYILHGTNHLQKSLQLLHQSYQIALETGDIEFVGHAAFHICHYSYFGSQELSMLDRDIQAYSQVLNNLRQTMAFNYCQLFKQVALNLLGDTKNPRLLSGDAYDEVQALPQILAANDLMALHFFYLHKLILGYLFGDTAQSLLAMATQSKQYLATGTGYITEPVFYFYDSLAALNRDLSTISEPGEAKDDDFIVRLQQVAANQAKLQKWADTAPMNHLHKWYLVEAERQRVLGNKMGAIDLYDQAIAKANENEYIQEAAIANELAAKFYLAWGKERIAQEYLTEAYYSYARWGAKAKIVDLETRYPQLLAPILQQKRSVSVNETVFAPSTNTSSSSSSSISDSLDLATILKASQTLSSEIELGNLLSSLLQLILENAGADKCVLLLKTDSQSDTSEARLFVEGLAIVGAEPVVLQRIPIEESQDIPLTLIYRVRNDLEAVVLLDATVDSELVNEPYFLRQQPKSILCSPILHQGKLLGIVYLENNLAIGAFTSDRVHVLNILCAQAAISLENAHLYRHEQEKSQALQASLEDLQQSELRFKQLFDQSADAILLLSDHNFIDCNQAAVKLFGYALREQLCMVHPSQISPVFQPDGESSFDKANAIIAQAQCVGSHQFEWVHQRENGETFWAEVVLTLIPYQGEQVLYSVVRDISDRKQAEKALKLTQFAIDHASLPVWWVKSNGQLLYVNDAACRDLGYSKAEILERYVWDFNPEFSEEGWEEHRQETEDKSSLTIESLNTNKVGETYPVEVTVNYIQLDGEGYHFAFVKNIRDHKQAEEEQARLLAILEATSDIVGIADAAGNNLYLNQAGQQILQIPAEEMNQFHISEVTAFSALAAMETEILPTAVREGIWSGESLIRNRNNEEIPVSQVLMSHKNAQGEIVFFSTIMRDIRDRKQAEQALQQKSQALEAALADLQYAQIQIVQSEKMSALGNLVAGVAHEINNPVGFIAGNLQPALNYIEDIFGLLDLYQQEYPNSSSVIQEEIEAIDLSYLREDLPKLIGSMKLGVDRICDISTSLRTFSRADKDYKVPFSIHEGIDSTILILKHRLKVNESRPDIEVYTNYGEIPDVECFPGQLNQVFMNVLANAIDALEETIQERSFADIKSNPSQIEIQTNLDNSRGQVIIQIRDNGLGISDEIKQRVFEHLFTTKAVGKGTGLGLAIAHQIVVEKHSGTISVNSTVGVGTEFVITLPVKADGSA